MTTAAASEMARLGNYDLSALLIQGASNQNTTNFANNARAAITSIRESVDKSTAFAINTDKVVKQNTANFASDARAALASIKESVDKSTAFAVNTDLITKQNATNFASDARAAISSLRESVSSKNSMTYAVKGDSKYDEDIDADSNGTITYSEYIKYATKQGQEKFNLPTNSTTFSKLLDSETGMTKPQILNMGKALNSYLANSKILPQSLIQKEA